MNGSQNTDGALQHVLDRLAREEAAALERLFRLLAIPSVSTDPAFHESCVAAAEWCAGALGEIGFTARVEPTLGKPMVVGHWRAGPPRALARMCCSMAITTSSHRIPLDEWTAPPFEPRLAEDVGYGRIIVARGASDDKGQLMTFIEAARAWIEERGALPVDVSVLIEGEEESGSPSLAQFLAAHGDEIKADIALVCDTGQWDAETPAITAFLRGLAFSEITVTGPSRDLHSGIYGGPALNPLRVLSELPGGTARRRRSCRHSGILRRRPRPLACAARVLARARLRRRRLSRRCWPERGCGEIGFSILEQLWSRPTAEINGIVGGYGGPGTKTVIPAQATAKLSFRLVPGQESSKIIAGLHRFVEERLPTDASCQLRA